MFPIKFAYVESRSSKILGATMSKDVTLLRSVYEKAFDQIFCHDHLLTTDFTDQVPCKDAAYFSACMNGIIKVSNFHNEITRRERSLQYSDEIADTLAIVQQKFNTQRLVTLGR